MNTSEPVIKSCPLPTRKEQEIPITVTCEQAKGTTNDYFFNPGKQIPPRPKMFKENSGSFSKVSKRVTVGHAMSRNNSHSREKIEKIEEVDTSTEQTTLDLNMNVNMNVNMNMNMNAAPKCKTCKPRVLQKKEASKKDILKQIKESTRIIRSAKKGTKGNENKNILFTFGSKNKEGNSACNQRFQCNRVGSRGNFLLDFGRQSTELDDVNTPYAGTTFDRIYIYIYIYVYIYRFHT